MKLQHRFQGVLVGLLVLVTVVAGAMPARAASNGLGISPRKVYTIEPGKHISDTLYINNLSSTQPLHLSLRVIDFRSKDETGSPALQLSANAPQTSWSLKPFITIPTSVDVPAGKSTNVPITIAIPAGQGGGSYYSAVEYTAGNGNEGENVKLAASSVSLVFVTVPGQAHESLKLKQFGAFVPSEDGLKGNFSSWFFTTPPQVLAYRLQNNGNVAETPSGSMLLKGGLMSQTKPIEQANPKQQLALIGQTRRFDACIEQLTQTTKAANGQEQTQVICKTPHLRPGHYKVQLDLFYGLNGNPSQEIVATADFWYLPVWFLLLVVLGLGIIAAAILVVVRKVRRPKAKKK